MHFRDQDITKLIHAGRNYKSIYLDISARVGANTSRSFLTTTQPSPSSPWRSAVAKILSSSSSSPRVPTSASWPRSSMARAARYRVLPKLNAEAIAELDPRTKTCRPWAREASLETLHVKLSMFRMNTAKTVAGSKSRRRCMCAWHV